MRGIKAKKLRRKSKLMTIAWLWSLVPDTEDPTKITLDNFESLLPDETMFFANNSLRINAFMPRWFYKRLKKNPNATVEEMLNGMA
jgi:hypothetical protein